MLAAEAEPCELLAAQPRLQPDLGIRGRAAQFARERRGHASMVTSADPRRPPLPATLKRCRPPPQGGRGRFVNSAASTGEARSDGAGAIAALQILTCSPMADHSKSSPGFY